MIRSQRLKLAGLCTSLIAVGALGLAGCSAAASEGASAAPDPLIQLDNHQLGVPAQVHAGTSTFTFATTDPKGHTILLSQLRPGIDIDRYVHDLVRISSSTGADPAVARAAEIDAVNLGGARLSKDGPVSFSTTLGAGEYWFLDFNSPGIIDQHPVVRRLDVTPTPVVPERVPAPDQVVTMADVNGHAQYIAPDVLPAHGQVMINNISDGIEEAVFVQTAPNTTAADIQRYFSSFKGGRPSGPSPFVGSAAGSPVLSGGHHSSVRLSLPPGPYAMVSFASDSKTGQRRGAEGMVKMVRLV